MALVSVVLPTFNEIRHGLLPQLLANLTPEPWLEVVAVDGASHDGTAELICQYAHVHLVTASPGNRAQRLNLGIRQARGEILFLHHPRSLPDRAVFRWLHEHAADVAWGALTHGFDMNHPVLKFTSWYSNQVRGRWRGIFYLDHCLFMHRRLWFEGALPEVDIFEDTLLSRELRRQAWPRLLPFASQTSATRFRQQGMWRQALLNQVAKLAFLVGLPTRAINRFYERRLNFNGVARQLARQQTAIRSVRGRASTPRAPAACVRANRRRRAL